MSNKRIRKKWAKYGRVRAFDKRFSFRRMSRILARPLIQHINYEKLGRTLLSLLSDPPKFGMLTVTTEE